MDSTLLPFALLCFTSFFTLTNPLGTMPVFLTMTHGMTDKERQTLSLPGSSFSNSSVSLPMVSVLPVE